MIAIVVMVVPAVLKLNCTGAANFASVIKPNLSLIQIVDLVDVVTAHTVVV